MDGGINDLVLRVLERAPQWVRQDLLTSDPVVRARAEETLAAMISSARWPQPKLARPIAPQAIWPSLSLLRAFRHGRICRGRFPWRVHGDARHSWEQPSGNP